VLFALVAGFLNVHSKVNSEQKKLSAARTELAQLSLTKKPAVTTTDGRAEADHPGSRRHERGAAAACRDHDCDVDANRVGSDPARVLARPPETT
jgi:hypothetical protein